MQPTIVPAHFVAKDLMSKSIAKMQASASTFGKQIAAEFNAAGKQAFAVGRSFGIAAVAMATPMVLAAKSAMDFETKMSNVATLIDTSKESISGMGDEVLRLSKKLPVPIDELTSSLYDIRSAGISAEKQFETLESAAKLSAAGLATVSEATNISTSALNAFKSEGLSAAQTNDLLFKTVKFGKTTISELAQAFGSTAPIIQSAGVKLADFSAATAALTTTGTPASQAQNSLRASVVSLQKPTAEMTKVFKALGVASGSDLIKKYGNLGDSFKAVNAKIKELNINNGQAWGSTEALAAVTSLTGATNGAYVTTLDDMINGTNALNDAFDKQSKTGKSQMQLMKNNIQALSISVGQALIPVINDLIETVIPYVQAAGKWISNNKELTSTIVKVAAGVAAFLGAVSLGSFIFGAFQKAMVIGKVAMIAFNAVAALNPFGAMAVAAAAVGVALYGMYKAYKGVNRVQELNNEVQTRALEKSVDQRIEVMQLFEALRKAKVGSDNYKATLQQIEAIQPGITEKYKLQAGAVRDIANAEKELIGLIMKRAQEEARAEIAKEKIKEAIMKREGGTESDTWVQSLQRITTFGQGDQMIDLNKRVEAAQLEKEAEILLKQNEVSKRSDAATPVNPNGKGQQKLDINITGLPEGSNATMNGQKVNSTRSGGMPALKTNL